MFLLKITLTGDFPVWSHSVVQLCMWVKQSNTSKLYVRPKKKYVCFRPTDPKILPNIFYAKKKNRLAKSENSSPFPCLFPSSAIFFISLYIRVITNLPNSEQSYKGKVKTQTKSVNNRKTVKTVMTLTWYRHF